MPVTVVVADPAQESTLIPLLGGVVGFPLMVDPLHGLAADLIREGSLTIVKEPASAVQPVPPQPKAAERVTKPPSDSSAI